MKKVLSWVLTLALVLGSFSMAFAGDTPNSSKMSDANTIKNVEAVDTMVATGIIGGYPDGSFQPEKDVTRAEMAKMISIAKNGGEDVGDYYKSSCTFADSVNHWAAGYIGYCANQGIIDGRSESVFDPNATVTGTEAAKMMLIALGYDSKIEGYTGSQWAAKVLKAAKENKLFDGCDNFKSDAALNRDNAAQIIFNGLNADMVEYAFDAEIKVGDTVVSVNTKVNKVYVEHKGDAPDYNEDEIVQLYEEAFDGDLVKDTDGDSFGRNATIWTLNDDEIGTYADEADFSFVVEKAGTILTAVKEYDEDFYDSYNDDDEWDFEKDATYDTGKIYVNGVATAFDADAVKLGDVVEFFDVTDKEDYDVYKVVVSHYEMAKISKVKTNVTDKEAKKGISAKITFDGGSAINDTDLPGYNAKDYVEDAVIAVAKKGTDVIDSFVPEMKSAEVAKIYNNGKSLLIDGEKVETASGAAISAYDAYDSNNKKAVEKDTEYDFYFVNGYIIGAVYTDSEDANYGIYLGKKTIDGDTEDDPSETQFKVLKADGETEMIDIDEDKVSGYPTKYDLIKYDINSDDEITGYTFATGSANSGKVTETVKYTKFAGIKVSEDVVIFADNNELANDRDFVVYGFDKLVKDDELTASYITDADGYIVAMCVTEGLGDVEDVIGLYVDNADNEITLMVEGEEEVYTINEDFETTLSGKTFTKGTLCIVTLNGDGEVKAFDSADVSQVADTSDSFDGYDALQYNGITTINEVEGNVINDELDVSDATIYYLNSDGDFETTTSIEDDVDYENATVYIYQTDKTDETWNIVFISK